MDIVIPLKRAIINEELRYTLRSICENVSHEIVWLSGYKPSFLQGPVGEVPVSVPFGNKYNKAANNILAACKHSEVTDDFMLFNDDFFVMKPLKDFKNMHRGLLTDHMKELEVKGITNPYSHGMQRTYDLLQALGHKEPLDYGLHIPMIINKQKWIDMWKQLKELNPEGKPVHLRTFYGNIYNIGGEEIKDSKIAEFDEVPTGEEIFLSSNDDSFAQGEIGRHVMQRFRLSCKYE